MKLGFFTACFPDLSLAEIIKWASEEEFGAIEVAAWPEAQHRPHTVAHLPVAGMMPAEAEAVAAQFDEHDLAMSSIGFYENNLHPNLVEREAIHRHLEACIDAAALLQCPTVGTFIGRHPGRTVAENLRDAEAVFPRMVDRARERGVKLVIENCVMEGWHPDGYPGNLAYSPELWEWMFSLGLHLNYDPSHLVWMGIDPVAAIRPYLAHVAHVQAKDVEIFPDLRNRYGYPGRVLDREENPWDTGWWRYRVPGLGVVDWTRVIDALHEGGFTGAVSIEHEDPVWSGTEDRIKTGLRMARANLETLVVTS